LAGVLRNLIDPAVCLYLGKIG